MALISDEEYRNAWIVNYNLVDDARETGDIACEALAFAELASLMALRGLPEVARAPYAAEADLLWRRILPASDPRLELAVKLPKHSAARAARLYRRLEVLRPYTRDEPLPIDPGCKPSTPISKSVSTSGWGEPLPASWLEDHWLTTLEQLAEAELAAGRPGHAVEAVRDALGFMAEQRSEKKGAFRRFSFENHAQTFVDFLVRLKQEQPKTEIAPGLLLQLLDFIERRKTAGLQDHHSTVLANFYLAAGDLTAAQPFLSFYEQRRVLEHQARWKELEALLREEVRKSRKPAAEADAKRDLAIFLLSRGDVATARQLLEEALALQPDAWYLNEWTARACKAAGDLDAAERGHRRTLEILGRTVDLANSNLLPPLLALHEIYQQQGRIGEAAEAVRGARAVAQAAAARYPESYTTAVSLAQVAHREGDAAAVVAHLEQAEKLARAGSGAATADWIQVLLVRARWADSAGQPSPSLEQAAALCREQLAKSPVPRTGCLDDLEKAALELGAPELASEFRRLEERGVLDARAGGLRRQEIGGAR